VLGGAGHHGGQRAAAGVPRRPPPHRPGDRRDLRGHRQRPVPHPRPGPDRSLGLHIAQDVCPGPAGQRPV
jgi:hypothetical protein